MIYDRPPKPFYAFDEIPESFHGFNTLGEAVAQAESWAREYYGPVYVFKTKCSFNTDPPALPDGRRKPTPEELKMP